MNEKLVNYLSQIDRYLKPIQITERTDIVQEIKSQIIEMEKLEGLSPDEIITCLGNPKDMANAYLGDLLSKDTKFNKNKVLTLLAYYSVTGITGAIVIPFLGILSPVLKGCAFFVPICGFVKLIAYILGHDLPIAVIQFGKVELNPFLSFPISIIFGLLFYKLSNCLWKTLLNYIQNISKKKEDIMNR